MDPAKLSENFYDKIKPRLYQRLGRELHSANHVLDIGCGNCELVGYLSETYGQKVTGIDISSVGFRFTNVKVRAKVQLPEDKFAD